jgi:hypothetical protein
MYVTIHYKNKIFYKTRVILRMVVSCHDTSIIELTISVKSSVLMKVIIITLLSEI